MTTIHVISTGFRAPTKDRCLESVARQTYRAKHVYVEASEQSPPLSCWQNTRAEIAKVPDEDVCALLDGDDWLATDTALETVANLYAAKPELLVTYGSFINADGRPGFAAPYQRGEILRRVQFRATHLKTFRASIFRKVRPEDLELEHARDHALMFPLLEMAGSERAAFVPQIIYVYNLATAFEFRASRAELEQEQEHVRQIRARPPYERLP
jgi:glycosyltransferase involved in cell wall biosynthesis